jgi:hypothetical protein
MPAKTLKYEDVRNEDLKNPAVKAANENQTVLDEPEKCRGCEGACDICLGMAGDSPLPPDDPDAIFWAHYPEAVAKLEHIRVGEFWRRLQRLLRGHPDYADTFLRGAESVLPDDLYPQYRVAQAYTSVIMSVRSGDVGRRIGAMRALDKQLEVMTAWPGHVFAHPAGSGYEWD